MAANKADQKQQQASKPTLPALPKFHALDTDSQDQQDAPAAPQYSLMSKLQSVLEADDDEEETGFEDLQVALQRVIKNKAAKQQQKQQAILQEVYTSFTAQHKSLEAAVAKDAKDGAALASSTFAGLNKKLSEKFKHIEALNAKYQQDLHASWEEYNELYSQLEDTKDQVLGVAEKRRAALKRKLSALQTSANEKLADAERKVAKINQQASKLPSLGNVLKAAFMGA